MLAARNCRLLLLTAEKGLVTGLQNIVYSLIDTKKPRRKIRKKMPFLLWNLEVRGCFHKSPQLDKPISRPSGTTEMSK